MQVEEGSSLITSVFPEEPLYVSPEQFSRMWQEVYDAGYGNEELAAENIRSMFFPRLSPFKNYRVIVTDWKEIDRRTNPCL